MQGGNQPKQYLTGPQEGECIANLWKDTIGAGIHGVSALFKYQTNPHPSISQFSINHQIQVKSGH